MDKLIVVMGLTLVLAVMVTMHSTGGEQILPDAMCLYCTLLFRSQGCLDTESSLCRLIALKFTADFGGRKLCDNFLCEPGYGQNSTTTECTGVLSCPVRKLRLQGICPTNQVCCAN